MTADDWRIMYSADDWRVMYECQCPHCDCTSWRPLYRTGEPLELALECECGAWWLVSDE